MKKYWFKEWGWGYYPISWQGIVLTIIPIFFMVQVFLAVDRASHSVSDTLYGIFPFWVPTALVWLWVASKTSQKINP